MKKGTKRTGKLQNYAIMTNSGAVVKSAKSALEAMNYFCNAGYNVTMRDVYLYNN